MDHNLLPVRLLSTDGFRGTTSVRRGDLTRTAWARRLIAECRGHDVAILNGGGGMRRCDEQVLAAYLARRSCKVLLTECWWEPGNRRLDRLLGVGRVPGVDFPPSRLRGALTPFISALDHPRLHYAVVSKHEVQTFPETWGVAPERVHFTPYWATGWRASPTDGGPTVFAGGDSMRDYRALLDAAPTVAADILIATRLPLPPVAAPNLTAGPLPPQEYASLSHGAAIHVVPMVADSLRSAGQQTYLTAMALGRPVIVTDSPGVRDYIVDGVTGLIVPPEDAQALSDALNRLLEDPATARRIGQSAAEAVADEYTGRHYTSTIQDLATRIAGSG